jgi:diguanylate cyclase (GGDEF)-like protein
VRKKNDMTRLAYPTAGNDGFPDPYNAAGSERRAAALSAAASLWSSSGDLFADDFMGDAFEEENDELSSLLARVESFSQSPDSSDEDLLKFRDLLIEVAHSVFLRWKVLHQLRTMALTDDMTGLYNRRGFLLLGMHNMRLALRTAQPLLLFFADVDGLKMVNDSCGHVQGDALLVACGEVLKMTFRESDIIARIGGDEFAVLAQANTDDSRESILSRFKSSMDLMNRDVLAPYQLSLSVGVAGFDPGNPVSLSELLSVADHEMMRQKILRRSIISPLPAGWSNGNGH